MRLPIHKLTKEQMINLGASGMLSSGYLRYIPIHKITGSDPAPKDWTDDKGNIKQYKKGEKINLPIEVTYNKEDDLYYLQNGNHRVKQGKINNDYYILAFVQPDRGQIGNETKTFISSLQEFVDRAKKILD